MQPRRRLEFEGGISGRTNISYVLDNLKCVVGLQSAHRRRRDNLKMESVTCRTGGELGELAAGHYYRVHRHRTLDPYVVICIIQRV